ncbi:ABC transporter substrate-binding protein, partial [Actinomadura keratinilytica]|uniref:ABC transporter substrate-binding protein n=2 Tax=Actinomadura keratinilytica TaxID=547461 RepID=UPI0031E92365
GAHPAWQQRPTSPMGPGGRPRRRGIGVLAAGGAAALAALVVGGSVVLVQLNRERAPAKPAEGGQVRVAMTAPQSAKGEIDPAQSAFGTECFLARQLFTGLTEIKQDGTSRLRMARSITSDDTCRQWKIEIKPGTTFSNGEPVDAEAFARGWARHVAANGTTAYLLADIRGYPAVSRRDAQTLAGVRASGNTLIVELEEGDCGFTDRLSDPVFAPVPRAAGQYDNLSYNTAPIGNGPFKLQSYTKDGEAVLVRNERWAFGKTRLDSVRVRLVPDMTALMTAFTAGTVDWAAVDTTTARPAGTARELRVRPAMSQRLLIPITTRGPLRDRRVRQAVSYALDRQQIATTAMGGLARPAIGLVSPALPGFDGRGRCPSCEQRNVEEAKRLAQEAGAGPGTEVDLHLRALGGYRTWSQAVAQQLEQVLGWKVTLRTYSSSDYRALTRAVTAKDAQGLIAQGWQPDYPSAYTVLQPLLAGDQIATADNGRANYGGWKDKTFDANLAAYLATRDEAGRTRLMRAAEKRALDDMAIIPVVTDLDGAMVSDRFSGLDLDPEGFPTVATAARR